MSRRKNISFGNFIGDYVGVGAIWALVISIIAIVICASLYSIKRDDIKSRLEGQHFVNALQAIDVPDGPGKKTAETIKKILSQKNLQSPKRDAVLAIILSLKESGITSDNLDDWIKVAKASFDKNPEDLPSNFYKMWEWSWFFGAMGYTCWAIFIICMLINLADSSPGRDRIVDLPWGKPWVWLFIVFTLPIGFLFYIISGCRLIRDIVKERRRERRRIQENQREAEKPEPVEYDFKGIASRIAGERRELNERMKRVDHPQQSKANWRKIHNFYRLERWEVKNNSCKRRVEGARGILNDLGRRIREAQEGLVEATKELRLIEAERPEGEDKGKDLILIDAEFERLIAFSRVLATDVLSDEIKVWTKPIIFEEEGSKYDLGSYLIEVSVDDDTGEAEIHVECIISGRLDGVKKHLYGGEEDGDFCFGDRNEHIYGLLGKGEYLAAIDLILQGIGYVNKSGRVWLREYYRIGSDKNESET